MTDAQQRKARALFASVTCDLSIARVLGADLREVMQLRREWGR
jgi:hypothetical protein